MTPKMYTRQLENLVRSGRHEEALELADRHWRFLLPKLTSEEFDYIESLTHVAQMAVDMKEASLAAQQSER